MNDCYLDGLTVEEEESDPKSVLSFYRNMIRLRKRHLDTLCYGTYEAVDTPCEKVLQYLKKGAEGAILFVALNFGDGEEALQLPEARQPAELLMSSAIEPSNDLTLQPYEGRIYKIESS